MTYEHVNELFHVTCPELLHRRLGLGLYTVRCDVSNRNYSLEVSRKQGHVRELKRLCTCGLKHYDIPSDAKVNELGTWFTCKRCNTTLFIRKGG